MPDDKPLDYFNANRPAPDAASSQPPRRPTPVLPAEFDTLLTRTTDHGALAAIEAALRVRKIASFRTDDGELVAREFRLHVRQADSVAAEQVAGQIFARRQRVKELLPARPIKPTNGPLTDLGPTSV